MPDSYSNEELSQFSDYLWKMKNDSANSVKNSRDFEDKFNERKVIVLRNNPIGILIFYGIFLVTILTMSIVFSFDVRTVTILFSVWTGTALVFIPIVLTHLLILHPDGFLFRKLIFVKLCQKWKNLTIPPEIENSADPSGGVWHIINFHGSWGVKKFNLSDLNLKDLKKMDEKYIFFKKNIMNYYERVHGEYQKKIKWKL